MVMARYQHYRCPECGGTFRFLHEHSDTPPPDRCPLCNAWVSEDEPPQPVFVAQAPGIRKSAYTKSVDQTYRAMEQSSIERADEAAALLESDYAAQPKDEHDGLVKATQKEQIAQLRSELKLTNMKDPSQMREGDTAHIGSAPLSTTKAQYAPYAGRVSGDQTSQMVPMIKSFTRDHTQRAMGMIRAGNLGTDRGQ
jgi:hypothetical protein